ncbi:MAG: PKD domain-containing protein [Candidatus Poseidoniales archaeon]
MKSVKVLALAMLFLLTTMVPLATVEAANEERRDTDKGYISEQWRAGLGTGLGALNSIKSADIDNDGEDELVFGNAQGFVHILEWDSENNGWSDNFHTIDMGGAVKGMEIAQIDDDPQLEIAVGYNWVSDVGKVKIIDGQTLLAETNWSSGVSWSHGQWTAGWPYGLAMGDLDGDDESEIAMGDDRGFLWVVETNTPEIYVGRDITPDEAEWYVDVSAKVGKGVADAWGITFGQFDDDEAMEVAVGTKEGWVAIFDGETEEMQWKKDMDGNDEADSLCYSLIAADLDGDDIDELIVPQQSKMTVFIDGDKDNFVEDSTIKSGYGLVNSDLFGNSNEELVIADGNGKIRIMGLTGSSLTTYQEWNTGYPMNTGAGITVSTNGHSDPWLIHGSDSGMVVAWEITSQTDHDEVWSTNSDSNENNLYSIEGGGAYGVAIGNIDNDDTLEMLVGSSSGRVYAYDGVTYETDWVSPVLEKNIMGIAVGDLNNDGDNDIAISTGNPGEPQVEGEGGEGYLYVFEGTGTSFTQAYQSPNIDAALGLTIAELDGSTYPEIGVATGYVEVIDPTAGTSELHGNVRVYGYSGSSYGSEWSSNDLGEIVGGIASGDLGGSNDYLVVGTSGDSRNDNQVSGEVIVYKRSGGTYTTDGTTIDSERYRPYGIAVGDVDNDGEAEIAVGTGDFGDSKPTVTVYEGSSHSIEYTKTVDTSSVWGVAIDDFDSDGFVELIYGTSGGEVFLYDGETEDFESKTSALSGKAGHYGGIAVGNLDDEGPKEMLIGSEVYLWLFTTEGQTDKPDLAIEGIDITYSPENPDEDEDIVIDVIIHNYGGVDAIDWRVKLYDGDPDAGGKKITEYSSDEDDVITASGGNISIQRTWYGVSTTPGYHELYAVAEDTSQPRQETRFSNNKDFTTIEIEEIPNDRPVIVASVDTDVLWIDEPVRVNAGESYDTETTDGEPDNSDGNADLTYRYYTENGWTSWVADYTWDISFSSPGNKEILVAARDERSKESEEFSINVEVKANTQPTAILLTNLSTPAELPDGGFVTFDVSQSFDPDEKSELEYRFSFGDGVYSDWVGDGQTVRLYRNAFFTGTNGGELQLDSGEEVLRNKFGIIRVFRLIDSELYEIIDSQNTGRGYNYSLPENTEEKIFYAQLMAREISDTGDDDILASTWSDPVQIKVFMPENILPVAMAQAGIFIEGQGIFSDRVDYAKTGDQVTYTATESTDPDGDDSALTFSWRILDSRGSEINLLGDKTMKSFKRTYNEPGTYTAILTVTDVRGGVSTWQAVVIVTAGAGYGAEVEEGGISTNMLIGGAALGVLALFGGARALSSMRGGGDEFDDMFEEETVVPGPLELQCPTCGGLISITTTQRPIQVGCPMCQAQFVIRE